MNELSADDMDGLADLFEGWTQSELRDRVNAAEFLGWADGLRSLVATVGPAYNPPEPVPGAPISLLKFMAIQMRG
jgi:hypothetical protein